MKWKSSIEQREGEPVPLLYHSKPHVFRRRMDSVVPGEAYVKTCS